MSPVLDARLAAAAALVRPGHRAADIGCDHGLLTAALVGSGRCPFVVAADLRSGPLSVAEKNLTKAGLMDKVSLRLGDGLSVLAPGEVQDVVIAGMGAETICDIIAAAPWLRDPAIRLVLVPATKHSILRRWLCRNGFALREERLAQVGRRFYAVMAAEYSGRPFEPEGEFCLLGLTKGLEGWQAYLRQQLPKLQKYRLGAPLEEQQPIDALLARLKGMLESEPQTP